MKGIRTPQATLSGIHLPLGDFPIQMWTTAPQGVTRLGLWRLICTCQRAQSQPWRPLGSSENRISMTGAFFLGTRAGLHHRLTGYHLRYAHKISFFANTEGKYSKVM